MASIRTMLKCSKVQLSALQIKLEKLSSNKDIVNGKIKVIPCIYYLDGRNWIVKLLIVPVHCGQILSCSVFVSFLQFKFSKKATKICRNIPVNWMFTK